MVYQNIGLLIFDMGIGALGGDSQRFPLMNVQAALAREVTDAGRPVVTVMHPNAYGVGQKGVHPNLADRLSGLNSGLVFAVERGDNQVVAPALDILRGQGVETLILSGYGAMGIGVLAAREAQHEGYRVVTAQDLMVDPPDRSVGRAPPGLARYVAHPVSETRTRTVWELLSKEGADVHIFASEIGQAIAKRPARTP